MKYLIVFLVVIFGCSADPYYIEVYDTDSEVLYTEEDTYTSMDTSDSDDGEEFTDSSTEIGSETGIDTETDFETDTDTDFETGTETDTDTDSETGTDTGNGIGTDPDQGECNCPDDVYLQLEDYCNEDEDLVRVIIDYSCDGAVCVHEEKHVVEECDNPCVAETPWNFQYDEVSHCGCTRYTTCNFDADGYSITGNPYYYFDTSVPSDYCDIDAMYPYGEVMCPEGTRCVTDTYGSYDVASCEPV